MSPASDEPERAPRGPLALAMLGLLGLVLFAGFVALGTWQVYRLGWKHDLIARVDARVHAPATAAPGPSQWPTVTAESDEYRRVRLHGRYDYARQVLVWASTGLGNGHWVMTPLRRDDGSVVLVNRGFVPTELCPRAADCAPATRDAITVTGLLRISQTRAFLRHNDPAHERWYARDVQAITAARGLGQVAPYFVDADAAPGPDRGGTAWPRGGLTVIAFADNHLSYLITWYLLAALVVLAAVLVGRHERRLRRRR